MKPLASEHNPSRPEFKPPAGEEKPMRMPPAARSVVMALVATLAPSIPTFAGEKVSIDGSTGVAPLVASLARAYQVDNPGTAIVIGSGLGTKARIQALREGRIDIAMASHGLDVPAMQRQGMVVHEIGRIAVVFGTNAGVNVATISESEVCAIYAGKLTDWKALGGSHMPIVPLTRPDSEVDAEVVRGGITCLTGLAMHPGVRTMAKSGDMADALAGVMGSVGMTTMTVVEQSGGRVLPLALGQVAPSAANVESRRYTLTRDIFLVVGAGSSDATRKFIDFVRSPAGAKVIAANGAVPVK
jgi:phosphate transport system substrate-binding protein